MTNHLEQLRTLAALDALKTAFDRKVAAVRATVTALIGADGGDPIDSDLGRITYTPARVEITNQEAFETYAYEQTGAEFTETRRIDPDADLDEILDVLAKHLPQAVQTIRELTPLSHEVALTSLMAHDGAVVAVDGTVADDFARVRPANVAVAASPQKKSAQAAAAAWVDQHERDFITVITAGVDASAVSTQ